MLKNRGDYVVTLPEYLLNEMCRCAFINFHDRSSAEQMMDAWAGGLNMDGVMVTARWARSKLKAGTPT